MSTECRPPFLKRLPENISLLSVLAAHGLNLDSFNGSLYLCPFHADKHPSLKLNKPDSRDGWFYCFGCNARGDMILDEPEVRDLQGGRLPSPSS
jgi:CHC2 zinc finger